MKLETVLLTLPVTDLLTQSQCARYLGISPQSVHVAIQAGRLKTVKSLTRRKPYIMIEDARRYKRRYTQPRTHYPGSRLAKVA